jgi:hypothetical protein
MDEDEVRLHYSALLARNYPWMAGGLSANIAKNYRFFSEHSLRPSISGAAIDLGAGCGFQSIALAEAGFDVVAVDFSEQMLSILSQYAGNLPVRIIPSDILAFTSWAGLCPELIVCMGDTITHMPGIPIIKSIIRNCAKEILPGGKIVFSFRDYSKDPEGTSLIIPVRRDDKRIFVCRLDFEKEIVRVTDILYTRESGKWIRAAGSYPKVRIAPDFFSLLMRNEGFVITQSYEEFGMTTIIAEKPGCPI